MANTCLCDKIQLGNTGTTNCDPIAKVAKKLITVPYYDSDGVINSIDLTATLNQAYFDALTQNSDTSKRWYPLPVIENVDDLKGDSIKQTFNSTKEVLVREGQRTFTGFMPNLGAGFLGKLKQHKCSELGVFIVDQDDNLLGSISADGTKLNPFRVDEDTWDPIFVRATDSTVQGIQLNFTFSDTERDENMRMVTCSEIEISLLDLKGLLDVTASYSTITTTGFIADVKLSCYGSAKTPIHVPGLLVGDFTLTEKDTGTPVVITTVTEDPTGIYTFVIPSQTPPITLLLTATKAGFDFTDMSVVDIDIT